MDTWFREYSTNFVKPDSVLTLREIETFISNLQERKLKVKTQIGMENSMHKVPFWFLPGNREAQENFRVMESFEDNRPARIARDKSLLSKIEAKLKRFDELKTLKNTLLQKLKDNLTSWVTNAKTQIDVPAAFQNILPFLDARSRLRDEDLENTFKLIFPESNFLQYLEEELFAPAYAPKSRRQVTDQEKFFSEVSSLLGYYTCP